MLSPALCLYAVGKGRTLAMLLLVLADVFHLPQVSFNKKNLFKTLFIATSGTMYSICGGFGKHSLFNSMEAVVYVEDTKGDIAPD